MSLRLRAWCRWQWVGLSLGDISPEGATTDFPGDRDAVFLDGGFAMKMPMTLFEEDARFQRLARWAQTDKSLIFCLSTQNRNVLLLPK